MNDSDMTSCATCSRVILSDGELNGETSSLITYVSACPASLISPEISSRRTRNRITGSETTLQIYVALAMTGKALFPFHIVAIQSG